MERMAKLKKTKKVIYVLIVIALISIMGGSLLYGRSEIFKNKANIILNRIISPGRELFKGHPAHVEEKDKKDYIADYYLSLESSRAADKIYILKKNDEGLFDELIKLMNTKSAGKTSEILKLIRGTELKKDFLSSTYKEIKEEKQDQIKNEVEVLENIDIRAGVRKVERKAYDDRNYLDDLPIVINLMDNKKASEILFYTEENIKEKVMAKLEDKKRNDLDRLMFKKEMEDKKLEDLAKTYQLKPAKVAIKEIGNEETYTIEQLSYIYMNLSVESSAEILAKIKNDEFVKEIFSAIGREEELRKIESSKIAEISEAIKFKKKYNKKIDELVKVYEEMSYSTVAKVTEDMMKNTKEVTSLEIGSSRIYEISDSTIIVDVLSRMKKSTLSKIMDNMDTEKASQLTQMLASP